MVSSVSNSHSQAAQLQPQDQQTHLDIVPVQASNPNVGALTTTMGQTSEENRLDDVEPTPNEFFKQLDTRPISQEQLVAEVKGIYAGLAMVESKCIEVINSQNQEGNKDQKLNNEQFQALTALHRTLLHEHHDFILASQHPSASPALKRLADKYTMPERMIKHAIVDPINLFSKKDESKEHYLTMLHTAHGICALLSETAGSENIKAKYIPIRDQLAVHIQNASARF